MDTCIFCKIINREIPSKIQFENDDCIIINDLNPQAPRHYLLIPKIHYANIVEFATQDPALLARCFKVVADNYLHLGLQNGFRLVTNKGSDGCQSVEHIHIHILGGNKLTEQMC